MNKKYIIVAVAAVVVLIGWQIYQKILDSTKPSVRQQNISVAVEVTPVKKATIREVGIYSGTLLPESQFIVAPKITGKLEKIYVDIGDEVKQDQLIALIDDDESVQQVDQARAELDVAMANIEENRSALNLARREFERAKALQEKKIVSESELDAAEAHYKAALAKQKVAVAQVAQKKSELKTAQVRLDYTRIRASWQNGNQPRVVSERYVDEGAMLTANAPIASIINIRTLKAVIHVIERDYPRVRAGQGAVIATDAYPDRIFTGTIERIAPILKEAARQARVEINVPNPDKLLKPGMFVRVQIEFDRHDNATVVPVNALIKSNGLRSVYLADTEKMRAKLIPVEVGIISGDTAEIVKPAISGLVVTVGQHLLEDGSAITLPEKK
jgi:RND family efflux transporter MFP subunit